MAASRPDHPADDDRGASAGLKHGRVIRLHSALVSLVSRGSLVFSVDDLMEQAQVSKHVAQLALEEWQRQGWLAPLPGDRARLLVTERCPSAPNASAIEALALLQVINQRQYALGRLTYGYGSALAFHGASDVVQRTWQVFHTDQTVVPPKLPPGGAFTRSTRPPAVWGEWAGRTVNLIRRHPDALRPYQRGLVPYQEVEVPCTTMSRTLVDAWLRPDLVGGEDRMVDAWQAFIGRNQERIGAVRRELAAILRDSLWPAARAACIAHMAGLDPAFAADHPDWRIA
jgi:predicted transcriptional regulator of viral defense system